MDTESMGDLPEVIFVQTSLDVREPGRCNIRQGRKGYTHRQQ